MIFKELPSKPLGFFFTEEEKQGGMLSNQRFETILFDGDTSVHKIDIGFEEQVGDFVFMTISRPNEVGREYLGCYGLGQYYYGLWMTNEWRVHAPQKLPEQLNHVLNKEDVERILKQRNKDIQTMIPKGDRMVLLHLREILPTLGDHWYSDN